MKGGKVRGFIRLYSAVFSGVAVFYGLEHMFLVCAVAAALMVISLYFLYTSPKPAKIRQQKPEGPRKDTRHIPQNVKIAVAIRDGNKCRQCGKSGDDVQLQYDHIYPWSLGGSSHDPSNIQLLCQECNLRKSNRVSVVTA